jgi:hypothetical protein
MMTDSNGAAHTALTPDEKLRAACAKRMYGTSDAAIALILGVSNLGRVNEGIKEVLGPLGLTEVGYKQREVAELLVRERLA